VSTPTLLGSLTIPGQPENVRTARKFITRTLGAAHSSTDTAVLLASELIANSQRHSRSGDGGHITIHLIAIPGGIRIEVADQGGASAPVLRPAASEADLTELAENGRGLELVDALASRWDYTSDATGTVTWFELAVPETE
jgi:anti-sigma regulatory factor (Ser/Thr protein kinase)